MNPKSREWEIWCRLDRFSRSRNRQEITGLTIDDIKKTLARAQPSDRGKAGAYIAGEEIIKEMENKEENPWCQRPLFVNIVSAVVTGIFALMGGYFAGVQKTINNVPIQSNNRQYGNIYAQQIIFNENGTIQMKGTALDQSTRTKVKFTAVSQDVAVVGNLDQTNVTSHNQSGGVTAKEVSL